MSLYKLSWQCWNESLKSFICFWPHIRNAFFLLPAPEESAPNHNRLAFDLLTSTSILLPYLQWASRTCRKPHIYLCQSRLHCENPHCSAHCLPQQYKIALKFEMPLRKGIPLVPFLRTCLILPMAYFHQVSRISDIIHSAPQSRMQHSCSPGFHPRFDVWPVRLARHT